MGCSPSYQRPSMVQKRCRIAETSRDAARDAATAKSAGTMWHRGARGGWQVGRGITYGICENLEGAPKMGDPQVTMGFNTKCYLMTWMIWGYPYLRKSPISSVSWGVRSSCSEVSPAAAQEC